jgi:hypothetical protein
MFPFASVSTTIALLVEAVVALVAALIEIGAT